MSIGDGASLVAAVQRWRRERHALPEQERNSLGLAALKIADSALQAPEVWVLREKIARRMPLTEEEKRLQKAIGFAFAAMKRDLERRGDQGEELRSKVETLIALDAQNVAAAKIQRAWRATPFYALRPGQVTKIRSRSFRYFVRQMTPKVKALLGDERFASRIRHALLQAQRARGTHQMRTKQPIFTSCGNAQKGRLPTFTFESQPDDVETHSGVVFTKSAFKELTEQDSPFLESKEQLDRIVDALFKCELFPWDYRKEGCFARANYVIAFLYLMGVSPESVKKQFVVMPHAIQFEGPDKEKIVWNYHVAPLVQLKDGSQWVIDPALSKDQALTLREWIEKQHIPKDAIISKGRVKELKVLLDKQEYVTYTTDITFGLVELTVDAAFHECPPIDWRERAEMLAIMRSEKEFRLLEPLINT